MCDENIKYEDSRVIGIPMKKYAAEIGNPRVFGTVAIGSLLKTFGFEKEKAEEVLREKFSDNILSANLSALDKGYKVGKKVFRDKETRRKRFYSNKWK